MSKMQTKNIALIVAAGKGERFGGTLPKQYQLLAGKTVLEHSVNAFLHHPQIDAVMVVINKEHKKLFNLDTPFCFGGAERQDSVRLGLEAIKKLNPKNVLIHDAARPFISAEIISRVVAGLEKNFAAIPVVVSTDSVRVKGKTVNREEVFMVQTPQGFDYKKIVAAHKQIIGKFTDDAQIADAAGIKINFVEGGKNNKKITNPSDLKDLNFDIRTGFGFDVHAFEKGNAVTICGIKIPHNKKLKGHSDADVGLHAITDAILGAVGAGDIGEHFPASDKKWKNTDSKIFLKHAANLVRGEIKNIDVTIICEEPKITPHKPMMKAKIAKILCLEESQVNVKATTTEGLGFTGRGEGIAAQAVATIAIIS